MQVFSPHARRQKHFERKKPVTGDEAICFVASVRYSPSISLVSSIAQSDSGDSDFCGQRAN
jgi:hypothetical protein